MVIAIIAVLASLLLPALSAAKGKAHSVVCMGNLRQTTLGYGYAIDADDGRLITYGRDVGDDAQAWLSANRELQMWWVTEWGRNGVSICPSAPERKDAQKPLSFAGTKVKPGTVNSAWTYEGAFPTWERFGYQTNAIEKRAGSYTFNAWLGVATGMFGDATLGGPSPGVEWVYYRESDIESPSNTPMFCDGIDFRHFSPFEMSYPGKNLVMGEAAGFYYGEKAMWAVTIPRHGSRPRRVPTNHPITSRLPGAINMSFYDGHVEQVKLERLWGLNWHRNYRAPAKRPGL